MCQANTVLEQSTEVLCAKLDMSCLKPERYVHSRRVVFEGIVIVWLIFIFHKTASPGWQFADVKLIRVT